MTLNPANQILFKYDTLYLLNEIHNAPVYADISSAVSPQGLIALVLSAPPNQEHSHYALQTLEEYSPGLVPLINGVNVATYCDYISEQIDRVVSNILIPRGAQTPGYFHTWQDLSTLVIHVSTDHNDSYALHQLARTAAKEQRFYDGAHAEFGRLGLPL